MNMYGLHLKIEGEFVMKSYLIAILSVLFIATNVIAAGSSKQSPAVSKDVKLYNKGVELMLAKKFAKAEKQFYKSLELNEQFSEAHNNLAYTLRKQGSKYYAESLKHYNRAIELKPGMAEAYMYRGVLHMQMGNRQLAVEDHQKLVDLGSVLAVELEYVIIEGREKEPEQFFGVSGNVS
jgi:tetratricopeptide (TPR) repeat protein